MLSLLRPFPALLILDANDRAFLEPRLDLILLIGLVASWVVLGFAVLMILQLIAQNGRVLERLDALEQAAAQWPSAPSSDLGYAGTLPVGVEAPPFALPDLNGNERRLAEWRGQRVLLVFFDPHCVFCAELLPSLAALSSDVIPNRPVPVVVTTGDLEENKALFDEAGFANPVLVQAGMEVAGAYKVDGTPMAYLIEQDGTIASEIAIGVQGILILAGDMNTATPADGNGHGAPSSAMRTLETSTLIRDGLRAGNDAPVFRLPRLDGSELSLLEYRGKKVMVVFSDPQCGPCDALAPLLEGVHRNLPELSLVMISRGDGAANAVKVAEYGLTFPVVLQRHWEVSRDYGMFATPIAYLIDEWGVIAAEVAVGPEAIIDLAISVSADNKESKTAAKAR